MKKAQKLIEHNDFKELSKYLLQFEDDKTGLESILYKMVDEALILIFLMTTIANKRNITFWYNIIGDFLLIGTPSIAGSSRLALHMFKKSFEINPKDKDTLRAILDFKKYYIGILTDSEFKYYSEFLLPHE